MQPSANVTKVQQQIRENLARQGVVTRDAAPPEDFRRRLDEPRPCGTGRKTVLWENGPNRGLPVQLFCSEPLCLNDPNLETRQCTGPRFLPTVEQYTVADMEDPARRERKISMEEALAAMEKANDLAAGATGVRDTRSNAQKVTWLMKARGRLRAVRERGGSFG